VVGEALRAPAASDLGLRFSDGARVTLAPDSRARVAQVDAHGAALVLDAGRVRAAVVHRSDTRWDVHAGPFTVAVTGTQFQVGWQPRTGELSVDVTEGAVLVSGPGLPARRVAAGESLRVPGAPPAVDAPPAEAPAPSSGATRPAPPPRATRVTTRRAAAEPAAPPAWQARLDAADYAGAMAALDDAQFGALCGGAGAGTLGALADAARLTARFDRAGRALRALRDRFPGDAHATVAAFDLGKIAFDQQRRFAEAARWFETYLTERPDGPLAREAAGRLMEAYERQGDRDRAREAARRYLGRYPEGPHAALARQLLAR
jgi:TolA-binding protein